MISDLTSQGSKLEEIIPFTFTTATASKISSFIKFTAESRHNRSRGTDQCDNNIIVDTAYCNVVSFNKIFAFH